jgi:hypothetical protein
MMTSSYSVWQMVERTEPCHACHETHPRRVWVSVLKCKTPNEAVAYAQSHGHRFAAIESNVGEHWLSRRIN